MTPDEFELAMLTIYLEDQEDCNAKFGGLPMHYTLCSEKLQKKFWEKHHLCRSKLLVMFERFFKNQPKPLPNETWSVFVAGGPCIFYKKSNWVEVNGKHYLQIGIRLEQYYTMRQRECTGEING